MGNHQSPLRSSELRIWVSGSLAVAVAALGLAACGSSSTKSVSTPASSAGSSAAPSSTKPIKVALVEQLTANQFMQTMADGSVDAAHDSPGVSLVDTGPAAPSATTEIGDISQVLAIGVVGMTVDPSPASLFTKSLGNAAGQTRLDTINDPPLPGTAGSVTTIGINEYTASRTLLDAVFAGIPPSASGSIVLGSCIPGNVSLDDRINAYKAYIKEKRPHITIVGPFTSTTDTGQNLANWKSAYASTPNALAYIGNCDSDGPSLVRLHQLHPGKYQTASFDIDPTTLRGIQEGYMTAAVNEQPYTRGYLATALLIDAARANRPVVKGFVNILAQLVTKSNVGAVIAREGSRAATRAGYGPEIRAFLKDPAAATGPIVLNPIADAYTK